MALAACAAQVASPSASLEPNATALPSPSTLPTPTSGVVVPAPGSDSSVYAPNPSAILVALDAGHGGCLDWGVADPAQRGQEYSEKAVTLAIARALHDSLVAEAVTVVMVRDGDVALAGDDYPPLDCYGAPFRDVNGDGVAGFGPDVPEGTRTRDELQARLDVANLVQADVLLSIHVDSIADEAGNLLPIARTETFYTDETPWGPSASAGLAAELQSGVMSALSAVAGYERQDRGTNAHNLYIVAPPLFEPSPERPDPVRQPTRGALMPAVLVEVGSISLPAEHALLLDASGQEAAAAGMLGGLAAHFGSRELAARIELADAAIGVLPEAVSGDGPLYWVTVIEGETDQPVVTLRLTNTGVDAWPADLALAVGWEETDAPYLRAAPASLEALEAEVPALAPGESVTLTLALTPPGAGLRQVAWITLQAGAGTLADLGSPPLQFALDAH